MLPGGVVICLGGALLGLLATAVAGAFIAYTGANPAPASPAPVDLLRMSIAGLLGFQVGLIALTYFAAGLFKSNRLETLALRPPRGGWRVLPLSLVPLFALTGIWTGLLVWLRPETVAEDLRPFQSLLEAGGLVMMLVIGVGAPLSEELLFRGFLFSGLAKSRLGLIGTSVLTTVLWTSLHLGYSIFGLLEVLMIGLLFSWLLIRTGSLWVTMFCHAVYNTAVGLALYYVTLPPPA